ncbi:MAG TPA: phosphatase PAP2 family protein [Thermoanaerobaculia bacterium]
MVSLDADSAFGSTRCPRPAKRPPPIPPGAPIRHAVFLLVASLGTSSALIAQVVDATPSTSAVTSSPDSSSVTGALGNEAKIYWDDAKALFFAPLNWGPEDQKKFVGTVFVIGAVMVWDSQLAYESQERRSSFTNNVSHATTGFGSDNAWYISGGLLISGLVLKDPHFTTMGREAIEASIFAGLITNILKPVFGRERPETSNNATLFKPLSSNYSFPSGHATLAFSVASVIAVRSSGWFWPTLAYTTASVVAFDRVNDRAHFPSDVIAGAAIGISVGRFIVHRHQRSDYDKPKVSVSLTPIPHGLGLVARF